MAKSTRRWSTVGDAQEPGETPESLLQQVARGDERAFEALYDRVADQVYGIVRRVVRDLAQSEEVAQEVLVEVWRTASRFDPARGSAQAWILTIAHRRAVDRVRSAVASSERELRALPPDRDADVVVDAVTTRLEHEQVRRCIEGLTDLQRQSVTLAYYNGYTYTEVGELLAVPPATIKTRIRDGLIRLRDCMGVQR